MTETKNPWAATQGEKTLTSIHKYDSSIPLSAWQVAQHFGLKPDAHKRGYIGQCPLCQYNGTPFAVGEKNGQLFCRYIRNHINSAQLSFDDIERLTPLQVEAMDRFDQMLQHHELCYNMRLEPGDIQLLNNHVVLHSRTHYVDFPDPAAKRHLLRLWLSSYQGVALPDNWKDAYKNVAPRSVRGGFRGTQITDEIRAYIRRLADETQMEHNSP